MQYAETAAMGLTKLRWRSFPFTPTASATPLVSTVSLTACTMNSGIATFTTSVAHRLQPGDWVILSGMAPADFTGKFSVQTVPDDTHFTVSIAQSGTVAVASGAPNGTKLVATYPSAPVDFSQALLTRKIQAQQAKLCADSGNVAGIAVGPDDQCDTITLNAGSILDDLGPITGAKFDLSDWYAKCASANQKLNVLYI